MPRKKRGGGQQGCSGARRTVLGECVVGEEEGQQDWGKWREIPVLWEFWEEEGKEKKRTPRKSPQGPVMVNLFCCQKKIFSDSRMIVVCHDIVLLIRA